jgi:hypothetical protein
MQMTQLNKTPPLYENYKKRSATKTFEQVEERLNELQDHIERLEADGEMEFFDRIASLEEKVEAIDFKLSEFKCV